MSQLNTVKKLNEIGLGKVRISSRGVPHLLSGTASVAWFWREKHYRIFWPYPSKLQARIDFKTASEVREWLMTKI